MFLSLSQVFLFLKINAFFSKKSQPPDQKVSPEPFINHLFPNIGGSLFYE